MIIDFHTHTFPEKIAAATLDKLKHNSHTVTFADGTADGLRRNMDAAGIDLSVILPVATAARQVEHINDASARLNEAMNDQGLLSLGTMHPDYEGYRDELARIRELGMKGFKIHPVYQGADIDDIRFLRILDRAAELGLIVVTHAGLDVGIPGVVHCSPAMCRHAVQEIGPFSLVLAHMGGWHNWDEVPDLLADTGVWLDTSFSTGAMVPLDGYWRPEDLSMLDADAFMKIVRAFGPDQILFGTDSPWSDPRESLDFIRKLPLTQEETDDILGRNAQRLLDI
ncbi:MAG: amidohydrolase family protein [Blautia sp.]|nr:amidohydrolase family protein [Blautia sp.]